MPVTSTVGVARRRSLIALMLLCRDPLAIALTAAASARRKVGVAPDGSVPRARREVSPPPSARGVSRSGRSPRSGYGLRRLALSPRASCRRCSRYSIMAACKLYLGFGALPDSCRCLPPSIIAQ
jgi:hypothetical protein